MSALTLMSVIAPAAPTAPQGLSDEAASGFQSLLATLSGEPAASPKPKSGAAEPAEPDEASVDASAASSLAVVPVPLAIPPVAVAVTDDSLPETGSTASAGGLARTDEDPGAPPTASTDAAEAPDTEASAPILMPIPTETVRAATPLEPAQPRAADMRPVREPMAAPVPGPLETATATAASEEPARTDGASVPAPSAPLLVAPPATPLRPLAERTSLSKDTASKGPDASPTDPSATTNPVRPTAVSPSPAATATPAEQRNGPADFTLAPPAKDTMASDESGSRTSEPLPPAEGTSAHTQGPAGARETGVSQLSRATIEATAQIAAQILRRLEGRSTRFEMALTPDELGRVDVKLDIDAEGRLNARLAFDNPAAATDLRGRVDDLRRQLEDAGFHLADDAFEFADRDSGSSAFDRGQDARDGSSRAFAAATRLNTEIDVAQPPRWMALTLSPSGVDMKV
ncbi:MAG: flagellar hook-length control protein FliK [Brevundimonas sp.]